jgi:hypothetical protein
MAAEALNAKLVIEFLSMGGPVSSNTAYGWTTPVNA